MFFGKWFITLFFPIIARAHCLLPMYDFVIYDLAFTCNSTIIHHKSRCVFGLPFANTKFNATFVRKGECYINTNFMI